MDDVEKREKGLRMRHYMMPIYKVIAHAPLDDATLQRDYACATT
jgi:hypothetical protein